MTANLEELVSRIPEEQLNTLLEKGADAKDAAGIKALFDAENIAITDEEAQAVIDAMNASAIEELDDEMLDQVAGGFGAHCDSFSCGGEIDCDGDNYLVKRKCKEIFCDDIRATISDFTDDSFIRCQNVTMRVGSCGLGSPRDDFFRIISA